MVRAKVTSKGQITLPKSIREQLRVVPGDRVVFHIAEDGSVRLEAATGDWRALVGSVKTTVRGVTIEQMDEGIGAAVRKEMERSLR